MAASLELLELYPSPFSERVRWVLDHKGVAHTRSEYVPLAGEEDLVRRTGIRTVPVLFADGEIVGDSNVAVDWIEDTYASPPLLPDDAVARAEVRAWELMATEGLAPAARLVMIGRYHEAGIQPLSDHFSAKYGWSPAAGAGAERLLGRLLPDLAAAVGAGPYLSGTAFTRADLTVATLLSPVLSMPPDELFELDDGWRTMFGTTVADDATRDALVAWRNETYRRHRGCRVTPAIAR
jgi:glutathione S-transferase